MKRYLYLITINVFILILSFIITEIAWRTILTIKHIENPNINYFGKTWYRSNITKITKFDSKLLSVPKPKTFIENVDIPRWKKNSTLSINDLGFRNNGNNINFLTNQRILTVGDSFTFGDQVSDEFTWPSCIERSLRIKVDNGGVGNYSTGQAVRRAIIESYKREYSTLIWSIYFHDFIRDFNKNIIIRDESNNIKFNNFSNKEIDIHYKSSIYDYFKEYFFTIYHAERILKNLNNKKKDKTISKYKDTKEKFYNIELSLVLENIDFLLEKFKDIKVDNKIILYQYGSDLDTNYKLQINKIKKYVYDQNYNKNFLIVDTLDIFKNLNKNDKNLIWFDHHTNLGNNKVCKYLVKKIKDYN